MVWSKLTPKKIQEIESAIQEDPVQRGINVFSKRLAGDLEKSARSLLKADRVYILTGFFIPMCGIIETDGLTGAVFLARALSLVGKEVILLLDDHTKEILKKGLTAIDLDLPSIYLENTTPLETLIDVKRKTVFVAVERPGRGKEGKYKTRKGIEIPAYPLDGLFIEALNHKKSVKTISCADGLNEVGMGKLQRGIIPADEHIQSVVSVDYLIVGGTADWAAFGLVALLSLLKGKDLLPTPSLQRAFLETVVLAGAVDGVTGKNEFSVDSLPFYVQQKKVQTLRRLL